MNFEWTDEQKEAKEATAAVFDDALQTKLDTFSKADMATNGETIRTISAALAKVGYWRANLSHLSATLLNIEIAKHSLPLLMSLSITRLTGALGSLIKQESGQHEMLAKIEAGEAVLSLGIVDVAQSSQALQCEKNDNGWTLTGALPLVANLPVASALVLLLIDEGETRLFLTEPKGKGLSPTKPCEMAGFKGVPTADLAFHRFVIEREKTIGLPKNEKPLARFSQGYNLAMASGALGLMSALFEKTKAHANQEKDGGKVKMARQEVRFTLAEMLTALQASELLLYRAAWMADENDTEAMTLADIAKAFTGESAETLSKAALHIAGLQALSADTGFNEAATNAAMLNVVGTPTDKARHSIAEDILNRI